LSGGLLTLYHPESSWTDTRRDQIAFGFRTTQSNAVIVRVASGTSTDYIDVELVTYDIKSLFAIFNVRSKNDGALPKSVRFCVELFVGEYDALKLLSDLLHDAVK